MKKISLKTYFIICLTLILVTVLLCCAPPSVKVSTSTRTVILISMDGMRYDYPSRDKLPAFLDMASHGLSAGRMTPPFPSLTFPSHSSIATGCYPDRHGIVSNSFLDVKKRKRYTKSHCTAGDIKVPPLWVMAEKAGIKSAVAEWPCSKGNWKGIKPTYSRPFGAPGYNTGTLKWIFELLDQPEKERPGLIMAWTSGADHPGHEAGPDSEAVRQAERNSDALIAKLRSKIESLPYGKNIDLIVISDHGMAQVTRMVDVVNLIPKHAFFPYIAISGPICNIYVKGEKQREMVRKALKKLPEGVSIYERGSIPKSLHYNCEGRTGDFVLICPVGWCFESFSKKKSEGKLNGMHGYLPEKPEMGGIFYATGPDFKTGFRLEEVRAIDVAPLTCRLLGIEASEDFDGSENAFNGAMKAKKETGSP